jgi:hypothetical protein
MPRAITRHSFALSAECVDDSSFLLRTIPESFLVHSRSFAVEIPLVLQSDNDKVFDVIDGHPRFFYLGASVPPWFTLIFRPSLSRGPVVYRKTNESSKIQANPG